MIITIHQPEHLPWLGLFNKIAKAEKFVILDSVQYEKNYFQNRNKIMGTNGQPQWIGIPVNKKNIEQNTIATTTIVAEGNTKNWKKEYLRTITYCYSKYPYFNDVYPIIERCINIDTPYFCEINIAMIKEFCNALDIHPEYIRSSEIDYGGGFKSDLNLNISKCVGADYYISGPSGRDYLNMQSFEDAGVGVVFNDYHHPEYPQRRSEEFVAYLSAVDLFMNLGFEEAKKVIMSGNEDLYDFDKNVVSFK
ncbi:MAG: WbqC family protein [Erysipelotrichaceae bacterium]|nr:WbqC family protein [Erysipelotrichaceae bacterium]